MTKNVLKWTLMSFALMPLVGCGDNAGDEASPQQVAEGEQPKGATVTVSGEIARRFDDHTFSLGDEEWGENLVIVTKKALPTEIDEDAVFEVTGEVRKYGVVEFETEYGWDFDPEVETELEDVKSYLYADSYTIVGVED